MQLLAFVRTLNVPLGQLVHAAPPVPVLAVLMYSPGTQSRSGTQARSVDPDEHGTQTRSDVAVPGPSSYWPAGHGVHSAQTLPASPPGAHDPSGQASDGPPSSHPARAPTAATPTTTHSVRVFMTTLPGPLVAAPRAVSRP